MEFIFNSAARGKPPVVNLHVYNQGEKRWQEQSVPVSGIIGFRAAKSNQGATYTAVHLHYYDVTQRKLVKAKAFSEMKPEDFNDVLRTRPSGDRFIKLTDAKTDEKVFLPINNLKNNKFFNTGTVFYYPHSSSDVPNHVKETGASIRLRISEELRNYPVTSGTKSDDSDDDSGGDFGLERTLTRSYTDVVSDETEKRRIKEQERCESQKARDEEMRLIAESHRSTRLLAEQIQLLIYEENRRRDTELSRGRGYER